VDHLAVSRFADRRRRGKRKASGLHRGFLIEDCRTVADCYQESWITSDPQLLSSNRCRCYIAQNRLTARWSTIADRGRGNYLRKCLKSSRLPFASYVTAIELMNLSCSNHPISHKRSFSGNSPVDIALDLPLCCFSDTFLRPPSDGRFGRQFTFVDLDGYAITIYDRDARPMAGTIRYHREDKESLEPS